jgi:Transposase IS116/IS110/IS902 family
MAHYGIGELTAPTMLCELGDVSRLSASRKAVRCAGLDVGVHRSDRRSRAGKLTRQGLAAAALGALRVSPSRPQTHAPRPPRLPRAQGPRALAHPSVADARAQTRAPLLPHAARTRPRRPRAHHLTLRRPVPPSPPIPDGSQSSGLLPQLSRLPPTGDAPPQTERPESLPAERPIHHHLAGRKAEHPDKPGRPRNERNHTTPQPPPTATRQRPRFR